MKILGRSKKFFGAIFEHYPYLATEVQENLRNYIYFSMEKPQYLFIDLRNLVKRKIKEDTRCL